jgi:hypothetical protein
MKFVKTLFLVFLLKILLLSSAAYAGRGVGGETRELSPTVDDELVFILKQDHPMRLEQDHPIRALRRIEDRLNELEDKRNKQGAVQRTQLEIDIRKKIELLKMQLKSKDGGHHTASSKR